MATQESVEVPLKLDPDAINNLFAQMIAESVIGERLKEVIEQESKKILSSFDNPLKSVVQAEVRRLAEETLRQPEIQMQLKALITAKLTPEFLQEVASQVTVKGRY